MRLPRRPPRPELIAAWVVTGSVVLLAYVAIVLGGGLVLDRKDSPHLGLSLLATVVVAAVINPVRVSAERWAARLMSRPVGSPYDVLARFSRATTDSESVGQAPAVIARMLTQGLAVSWTQVWLLVHDRPTLTATYPPEAAAEAAAVGPPRLYDAAPGGGLRVVTVANAGRPLGVLRVRERDDRPLTAVEERLLAGLAAEAGLVLHTVQLRAELADRLAELSEREAELRRARSDLVVRQDQERRRLERDIHDGAQQQIIALTINLKLARTLVRTEPTRLSAVLAEQVEAASQAIETLTGLSRGLRPGVLVEAGLVPALAAATAGNPVPVTVSGDDGTRQSAEVEAALYFCALEAVQNATKHAGASRIDVRVTRRESTVVLTVEDDGRGLAAAGQRGSGLANMRDRVAGVRGSLAIGERPGGGTVVSVSAPTPSLTPTGRGD